jgi:hypothetical protein
MEPRLNFYKRPGPQGADQGARYEPGWCKRVFALLHPVTRTHVGRPAYTRRGPLRAGRTVGRGTRPARPRRLSGAG